MTIDEKDLEIARLKGKIEALEGELAKERAARATPPPAPHIQFVPCPLPHVQPASPPPYTGQPFQPFIQPPGIVPFPTIPQPLPIWPTNPPIVIGQPWYSTCGPNVNACNPATLGEVWVGETRPSLDTIAALSSGKIASC
jgi:hypothetical protein